MANLNDNIQYLKGVGEKRALLFKKLGTQTIGALLRFYPRSYENWSNIIPIAEARGIGNVCIKATVTSPVKENFIRKNMVLYKFTVADSSGSMLVTIFNNKYDAAKIHMGEELLFYGKLSTDSFYAYMSSPKIKPTKAAGIRPIYPAVSGLSSTAIENQIKIALSSVSLEEFLPQKTIEENGLCSFEFALSNIHFPESEGALERARKRLIFEELFLLQTSLLLLKNINRGRTPCVMSKDYTGEFIKLLPFSLTNAQRRAINDCVSDISANRPMNRLIQGDVGSGKTAVCAAVSYSAVKNGFQTAVMVPTEILAEQHFATFKKFLENTGVNCDLLTGRLTKKQKALAQQRLISGETDIVIGTHALLSDNVEFKNLGLVVTDEQHRFGVEQRANLTAKGEHPHVLVMSATPIPRTLALIIYGDLDVSIIDEYPKGRIPIESYSVSSKLHPRVYNYIKKHIAEGRQGYIVCPLVEENDSDLIPAEEYYERLKENEFKGYRLGLIHGKMKAKEKDSVMREMALGNIDLLIATTVIEVGIDIPNAAIMVIENAERFGLSQLHQLRGRIGRGGYKSTCIFISDGGQVAKKRLDIMCSTNDGFKIADEDLKLRGPGDFLGNRQHGLPELHIADFVLDIEVLRSAGVQAKRLLAEDNSLKKEENQAFKNEIKKLLNNMKNN